MKTPGVPSMSVDVLRPEEWFGGGPSAVETLREFREDLHRNPELSFEEHQTTDRIEAMLSSLGLEKVQRFERTGLALRIPGTGNGPTVAVRGDIDALPIQENNSVEFASRVPGVMHACGHDIHAAWAAGAALLLSLEPPEGDVVVVFQPAEELGLGAATVIDSGVLEGVSMIFGAHVDPRWIVGEVVADLGPVAAATDEFLIRVVGMGGHGARPQLGRDPVVAASMLVVELQTIVARRVTPGDPAVVTVGEFHAGTAANIIPGEARLAGTLRSVTTSTRVLLRESVEDLAMAMAGPFGVEVSVEFSGGTPPLVNSAEATGFARTAAINLVGEERLSSLEEPNMGGEDFAVYLENIPGCFLRIGSRFSKDATVGAHTPDFFPQTECVFVGATILADAARAAARATVQG